ncbi:MAG: hypothetical protein N2Z82_10640 [Thermomicrobium sp.]|nr:hypothetical protein [Thermomicrobium sp.]
MARSPQRLNRLLFRIDGLGVALAAFIGGNVAEAVWLGRRAAREEVSLPLALLLAAILAWLGFWVYGTDLLHLWSDRPCEAPRATGPVGRPERSSRAPCPERSRR